MSRVIVLSSSGSSSSMAFLFGNGSGLVKDIPPPDMDSRRGKRPRDVDDLTCCSVDLPSCDTESYARSIKEKYGNYNIPEVPFEETPKGPTSAKEQRDNMVAEARSANENVKKLSLQLNIAEEKWAKAVGEAILLKYQLDETNMKCAYLLSFVESYLDGYLAFKTQAKKNYSKKSYPTLDLDSFEKPSDKEEESNWKKNDSTMVVIAEGLVAKELVKEKSVDQPFEVSEQTEDGDVQLFEA
ncbi:unnamed protein product [Ilex paraguariensis]|uniref:Uncharacterized protein n=1 Tax=Ilex paraguariensis TaxID=185542 RepID=A0ABC8UT51_9AQUA